MFRFACLVALWGGRGAADKSHQPVWGALTVFWPHWVCSHSRVCAFPIYTAQAPGCSIWSGPCVACGSSFQVLHKSADSVGPVFCAFPGLSSSSSQELDRRTLPRVRRAFSPPWSQPQFPPEPVRCTRLLLSASPAPVPARAGRVPVPRVSPRPSRQMSTIQNLRKSLVRNWRPVCSVVGDVVLGVEPAPFPSPLPPASGRAGLVRSLRALLWTCSDPLCCERQTVCSG